MGQVVSLEELRHRRQEWRRDGRRLVLTNGCFDLLHRGHVLSLTQAKALGDLLVVGLNSDASTRRLKGEGRPILSQEERAEILAALAAVDFVVIFDEDTAEALVVALQPDIYVKGGDYAPEATRLGRAGKPLPEAAIVASYGGRVEILPLVPQSSTTDIVERILSRYLPPRPGPSPDRS